MREIDALNDHLESIIEMALLTEQSRDKERNIAEIKKIGTQMFNKWLKYREGLIVADNYSKNPIRVKRAFNKWFIENFQVYAADPKLRQLIKKFDGEDGDIKNILMRATRLVLIYKLRRSED